MKKIVMVEKQVEQIEDVICDSCGESCKIKIYDDGQTQDYNIEYMTLKNAWGFGSRFDTEIWEAHVCEKCVCEKLIPLIQFWTKEYIPGTGDVVGSWQKLDWEERERWRHEWENGGREKAFREQEERIAEGKKELERMRRRRPFKGRKG